MVQCRKKSRHDCRSDRLTVSTVAATVTVTAAVTVLVTAAVTAAAMDTQIYRDKKRLGPQPPPPPRQGGEPVFLLLALRLRAGCRFHTGMLARF